MNSRLLKYFLCLTFFAGVCTNSLCIEKPALLVYVGDELKYQVPISTDIHIITDITDSHRIFIVNYPHGTVIGTRLKFGLFDFIEFDPGTGDSGDTGGSGSSGSGTGDSGDTGGSGSSNPGTGDSGDTGGSGSSGSGTGNSGDTGGSGSSNPGTGDSGDTGGSGSSNPGAGDSGDTGGSGSSGSGTGDSGDTGGSGSSGSGTGDSGDTGGSGSSGSGTGNSLFPSGANFKTTVFRKVISDNFVGIEYISHIENLMIKVDGKEVYSQKVEGAPYKRVEMTRGEHILEIGNVFKGIKVVL